MAAKAAEPTNQSGLWDREIDDPKLTEALAVYHELRQALGPRLKDLNKAKRTFIELAKAVELQDGERIRIGDLVIVGKARNGGGFEVPAWTSVTVGEIRQLPLME